MSQFRPPTTYADTPTRRSGIASLRTPRRSTPTAAPRRVRRISDTAPRRASTRRSRLCCPPSDGYASSQAIHGADVLQCHRV